MVEDSGYKLSPPGNANVATTIMAPKKKLLVIQKKPLRVLHPKAITGLLRLQTNHKPLPFLVKTEADYAATSLQEGQEHPVKECMGGLGLVFSLFEFSDVYELDVLKLT